MSKLGLALALIYLAVCAFFMYSHGLFGESFITIILGLPWSMALAYFEYFNAEGALAYVLAFLPIILNAAILYWIGSKLRKEHVDVAMDVAGNSLP